MPKKFYCIKVCPTQNTDMQIVKKGSRKQLLEDLNSYTKDNQIIISSTKKIRKHNDIPGHIVVEARPFGMPGVLIKWMVVRCKKWNKYVRKMKTSASQQ